MWLLIAARSLADNVEAPILLEDFSDALTEECVVVDQQESDRHGPIVRSECLALSFAFSDCKKSNWRSDTVSF